MEYRSKYKAEEIEAILDAKNNTGEGVDSNLDVLFAGQLQTKEVEVSEDTTIKADEGFLGLKEVSVKVSGGSSVNSWKYFDVSNIVDKAMTVNLFPFIAKNDTGIVFFPMVEDWSAVSAVGVDVDAKISIQGMTITWAEAMAAEGLTPEVMAQVGIVEITEEAFYAL